MFHHSNNASRLHLLPIIAAAGDNHLATNSPPQIGASNKQVARACNKTVQPIAGSATTACWIEKICAQFQLCST
jgi:uncharacterized protein (DUF697 family)